MKMNLLKKMALREIMNKAVELHGKGMSVEQIAKMFLKERRIAEGLEMLGVSDAELTQMIEKKVSKKKESK